MTWIADALSHKAPSILEEISKTVRETSSVGSAVSREEILKQSELTLELLVLTLRGRKNKALLYHWESIGQSYTENGLAMTEIPNIPELVKNATWSVLRREVEDGAVSLAELVDSMMEVESTLSKCWVTMVRSYLASRDIRVAESSSRMEALYSLTEVLSTESDNKLVYGIIVDEVAKITGLSRCSLLLFDDEGILKPVASSFKNAVEGLGTLSAECLRALATVTLLGGTVILQRSGDNPPELGTFLEDYESPSLLLVPLISADKDLGLLLLDEGKSGEFSTDQIDLAVASANQAAVAVEKSTLLKEMENQVKHMAAIGIVARTLSSYLDPAEQLQILLDMATALTRADRGVVMLTEVSGDLKVKASVGKPYPEGGEAALARIALWVVDHTEVLHLRRGIHDLRFGDVEMNVEASITAPLLVRDKVIGVMSVATARLGEHYSKDEVDMFGNFAAQAAVSVENTQLYARLQEAHIGTIASLAAVIEARDPYTIGHSTRVTQYAVAIAEAMGLPSEDVEEIRLASLLHDVGKIGVPDRVLNKTERLTEEEYSAIRMHPTMSVNIIEPLPHLAKIIPVVYHHHERYDGTGYVEGKAGDKIPLGSRIIAAADAFEAMTSDRPYRRALSREQAISELRNCAGTQFDPEVIRYFLKLLEDSSRSE
jgi:putative nucleotidyltransferase with HDIG domain